MCTLIHSSQLSMDDFRKEMDHIFRNWEFIVPVLDMGFIFEIEFC